MQQCNFRRSCGHLHGLMPTVHHLPLPGSPGRDGSSVADVSHTTLDPASSRPWPGNLFTCAFPGHELLQRQHTYASSNFASSHPSEDTARILVFSPVAGKVKPPA